MWLQNVNEQYKLQLQNISKTNVTTEVIVRKPSTRTQAEEQM